MNYQIFPLFINKISHLLIILAATILAYLGYSALVSYLILLKILFPIVICLRLHILSNHGAVQLLSEKSEWMIYIAGFPANEQRLVLNNISFTSPERLRQFYLRGFTLKSIIQLACIIIALNEYAHPIRHLIPKVLALPVIPGLIYMLSVSGFTLLKIIRNEWPSVSQSIQFNHNWYQGYLLSRKGTIPMLSRLF
ncbi:hypothetical protein [Trabulsiella odontotermitis]|uniref:hypothetical protein n=1 Tax=Trabulsiella odontotermitis TaxID=379893 RepID=UPI00128F1887|nr:hypothetical protein [Trabulsiella odontotermitis]